MTRAYIKSDPDELIRIAANRALIRRVPCPRCGAAKFAYCVSPAGYRLSTVHAGRRSRAADAGIYTP